MRRSGLRAARSGGAVTAVLTLAMIGLVAGFATAAITLTGGESVQGISADSSVSSSGDHPYDPASSSSDLDAKGKKGKLPFRTGSIVRLVSPGLERACDVASDPAPYGPYGPGGDTPYSPGGGDDGGGWWARRSSLSSAGSDGASLGRKGGSDGGGVGGAYDYGGGDDAPAFVWCNATIPDGPPQPYPSGGGNSGNSGGMLTWMGSLAAAVIDAAATALGVEDAVRPGGGNDVVRNSQWDLDGFVLMGTDFQTADMYSGGRVFLKNQNSRKFCRLAGSKDDGDDLDANAYGGPSLTRRGGGAPPSSPAALVCDEMTSSELTEFVVELVQEDEEEQAVARMQDDQQDEQDEQDEQGELPPPTGSPDPQGGSGHTHSMEGMTRYRILAKWTCISKHLQYTCHPATYSPLSAAGLSPRRVAASEQRDLLLLLSFSAFL
ncbi:hypothetical protein VOLCADRAFT_93079 [Volvox carteri f. nagariensis]|uniref:Uncharacterized protein n=1 Tax=Volvox carteri f. nagariensis TaxID=3068 RepID=D8U1A4_VOLCA|nr:uncharacterized protein VOLCADRAFT_93079 [Volvox carteri f. nagariensis]EFJ46523.1 hypothetical protein VOLCADRAFT_93079 [Volvox carteri f. nagariensis]|eukprot:XP_002952380.1 hypothetical protein VOLCADRAFT_93079 [Volvox carteri f. nagariensis]